MKFIDFMKEARDVADLNAKRMGWVKNKHGDYYDRDTAEFVAKKKTGKLKLYNQRQKIGKDPDQSRKILQRSIPPAHQTEELEQFIREQYIKNEIFNEGDWVKSIINEKVGKIIRRGANHLICVTDEGEMFKSWIKDVVEWTEVSGVPADQRLVGTDAHREYVMKMTGTKKILNFNIKNFINKYKEKNTK
jgi:hypothetical protein